MFFIKMIVFTIGKPHLHQDQENLLVVVSWEVWQVQQEREQTQAIQELETNKSQSCSGKNI